MLSPPLLLYALIPSVLCQFLSPALTGELWKTGEKRKVFFNTTLKHCTVGLWQKTLPVAVLGDVVFSTDDAKGGLREFSWEVQAYGLDLSVSNVVYFWLFEGAEPNQGNQALRHTSSIPFNITDDDQPSKSAMLNLSTTRREPTKTVILSKTMFSSPSSSSPAETSMTILPLSPGMSEAVPTTRPSMDTTTPLVETSEAPSLTQTTDGGGSTSSGTSQATQTGESSSSGSDGGLPVGAQAGMGVGIGIIGITCIVCAVMQYRYLKKNQKALAEVQEMTMSQSPAYSPGSVFRPVPEVQSPTKSTQEPAGYYVNSQAVEIA
ncbi:uncharacterized protein ColSpa_08016 [Colletotrichum spaethianum]|uniref:Uncharacterized protein n=1 Tax=Colletotrichum spaethianum TaxID=700344 RepID=A0AA37UN43_9PEZI|nr:uncharacterized protein ColSpa_08016 [Colletotrichum spaethianum]GKT47835.1 hypothetical protein ColSpa_08016 [Colletotrichum spaethianum]